jgi:hypothetical protein
VIVRDIIQHIDKVEGRPAHSVTAHRVRYFGMSYDDTVAAADLCGRMKRAAELGPSPTAAVWEASEDRNAPWAWEPINNPYPPGSWEHDDYHDTESFRQAFSQLPNARKE